MLRKWMGWRSASDEPQAAIYLNLRTRYPGDPLAGLVQMYLPQDAQVLLIEVTLAGKESARVGVLGGRANFETRHTTYYRQHFTVLGAVPDAVVRERAQEVARAEARAQRVQAQQESMNKASSFYTTHTGTNRATAAVGHGSGGPTGNGAPSLPGNAGHDDTVSTGDTPTVLYAPSTINEDQIVRLAAGTYTFPFSTKLPATIPPSLSIDGGEAICSLVYTATARVLLRSGKRLEVETPFRVRSLPVSLRRWLSLHNGFVSSYPAIEKPGSASVASTPSSAAKPERRYVYANDYILEETRLMQKDQDLATMQPLVHDDSEDGEKHGKGGGGSKECGATTLREEGDLILRRSLNHRARYTESGMSRCEAILMESDKKHWSWPVSMHRDPLLDPASEKGRQKTERATQRNKEAHAQDASNDANDDHDDDADAVFEMDKDFTTGGKGAAATDTSAGSLLPHTHRRRRQKKDVKELSTTDVEQLGCRTRSSYSAASSNSSSRSSSSSAPMPFTRSPQLARKSDAVTAKANAQTQIASPMSENTSKENSSNAKDNNNDKKEKSASAAQQQPKKPEQQGELSRACLDGGHNRPPLTIGGEILEERESVLPCSTSAAAAAAAAAAATSSSPPYLHVPARSLLAPIWDLQFNVPLRSGLFTKKNVRVQVILHSNVVVPGKSKVRLSMIIDNYEGGGPIRKVKYALITRMGVRSKTETFAFSRVEAEMTRQEEVKAGKIAGIGPVELPVPASVPRTVITEGGYVTTYLSVRLYSATALKTYSRSAEVEVLVSSGIDVTSGVSRLRHWRNHFGGDGLAKGTDSAPTINLNASSLNPKLLDPAHVLADEEADYRESIAGELCRASSVLNSPHQQRGGALSRPSTFRGGDGHGKNSHEIDAVDDADTTSLRPHTPSATTASLWSLRGRLGVGKNEDVTALLGSGPGGRSRVARGKDASVSAAVQLPTHVRRALNFEEATYMPLLGPAAASSDPHADPMAGLNPLARRPTATGGGTLRDLDVYEEEMNMSFTYSD